MSQTTSGGSIPPFVNHAMKLVLRSPLHGMVSKAILVGAAYPAPAGPQSVGSSHPRTDTEQKARLSEVVHA